MRIFSCFRRTTNSQEEKNRLLYYYVYKQNHKKALKMLKNGANPNTTIFYNEPLDLAIHYGDLKMIRILIYHGAEFKELSKMFCKDCRHNHEYILTIYESYRQLHEYYINQICLKYKIPPGIDEYIQKFI